MIAVIGGVYVEQCASPHWDAAWGSGGRAAACLSTRCETELHTVVSSQTKKDFADVLKAYNIIFRPITQDYGVTFRYLNPMVLSEIVRDSDQWGSTISQRTKHVLVFGMINCTFKVHAEKAVFDPQGSVHNVGDFSPFFRDNGSTADQLVYVLNENEIRQLTGFYDLDEAAASLINHERPYGIIVKLGPLGARVYAADGSSSHVPSYRSRFVFKIGSGDIFSAAFAFFWMEGDKDLVAAADLASRAVAAYAETKDVSLAGEKEITARAWTQ